MKAAMQERLAQVAFELYNEGTPHLPWEDVGDDHRFVWRRVVCGIASEAKRIVRRQKICDAVQRRRDAMVAAAASVVPQQAIVVETGNEPACKVNAPAEG